MIPKAARRFLRRNETKAARISSWQEAYGFVKARAFWRRWKEAGRILMKE
jgi:hypothetical protein